jgi:hypothetical protein
MVKTMKIFIKKWNIVLMINGANEKDVYGYSVA